MPFFINDSLSLDYLVGDKPYVGLTAYGDGLEADEKISFELTIKELPAFRKTADAKSFERVNIPLPNLQRVPSPWLCQQKVPRARRMP